MSVSVAGTRSRPPDIRPRPSRPVVWWAALGAGAIAFQVYVYTAWILSDDFKTTPTGADPVPQIEKVFAWILQPTLCLIALSALIWVIRGCRRAGTLTLDAKLLIAGYCQLWLDPIGSLIRPEFFFNAYYVNHGSWIGQIPGAMTPNGHQLADLPLVEGPVYGSLIWICVGGCAFMRWIRRRRPQISNTALVLWAWAAIAAFIFVVEAIFVMRAGAAVWLAPVPWLTLFYDTRYQMSLIPDPLFWGGFMLAMVCLRFFATDRGTTLSDAGLEQVRVPTRRRTAISTLGVVGCVSAAMLIASVFAILTSLYSTTPDNLPSYLRNGICGEGTDFQCPDRGVPIQTRPRP